MQVKKIQKYLVQHRNNMPIKHELSEDVHDESIDTPSDIADSFFADDECQESIQKKSSISPIPILPQLSMALGLLLLVFGVTYISIPNSYGKPHADTQITSVLPSTISSTTTYTQNVFDDIHLVARSAIVWDVKEQKVLFNKNADDVLPLASLTKLMTALVAYELLDTRDHVTISSRNIKTDGDSGFIDGETFTMQDLADITLISSSNDGASALSSRVAQEIEPQADPEVVMVHAMNIRAHEIGLTRTMYKNSTGLDISLSESGATGSARDMAILMEYILLNTSDALALTSTDIKRISNTNGAYHLAKNTNEIVTDIDGLLASKTGYTELAGGNLVVAFNAGLNHPIIITVLGSTFENRFSDTLTLIERTRTYLNNQ